MSKGLRSHALSDMPCSQILLCSRCLIWCSSTRYLLGGGQELLMVQDLGFLVDFGVFRCGWPALVGRLCLSIELRVVEAIVPKWKRRGRRISAAIFFARRPPSLG